MFVIQSGRVTITKRAGGVEKVLSALGPGEFFGEMSILSNGPRSATAVVAEDARILVIDSMTFEAMIRSNGEIALRMIKKLAERLRVADDQISNLLVLDASSRIVHHLAVSAERAACGAGPVRLPASRAHLHALVGLEVGRVQEVLSRLVRAHIIEIEGDAIVVPDTARLRRFLESLLETQPGVPS